MTTQAPARTRRPLCLFGKPQANGYRPVYRDGQQIGSVRVVLGDDDRNTFWIVNQRRCATWKEAKRALEAR